MNQETPRPNLDMEYHGKSGRYSIKDTEGRLVQMPSEERIRELWNRLFPDKDFFLGNPVDRAIHQIWVSVGTGTKPRDRERFCDALAKECVLV